MGSFGKGHHLQLIDGSAFIFRAFHALPPLTRKSDGLPIGAVSRDFATCCSRWSQDNKGPDAPTHVAVVFDKGSHTFRNDLYDQYKANRDEMPEDLRPQMPLTRDATRAFNIACIEKEGYEADDIIATYARQAREAGWAGDDHQLGQGPDAAGRRRVEMFDAMKNARIGPEEVEEEVRRRAGKGDRCAGAGRRQRRQHPRRAGDRGEDRGASDQRIRRSRYAAGARRRDQATQAPPDADRQCRSDPSCRGNW